MRLLARRFGVMVAISALAAMGRVDAASITYTTSVNSTTQPGSIPEFNTSLGTLLEVDFSATGTASALLEFPTVPASGTYFQSISFLFVAFSPQNNISLGPFPVTSADFSSPTGLVNVSNNFNIPTGAVHGGGSFSSAGGNGSYNLQIAQSFQFAGSSGQPTIGNSLASGTATVTYIYAPLVPEPPGLIMAGTALVAGLGYGLRRRRRAAP